MTRPRASHCASAALLALAGACPWQPAHAQGCYIGGVPGLAFGTVSPDDQTEISGNIPFLCQANNNPTYFNVCVFLAEGSPLPGVNPRFMSNYNGAQLRYDLYGDAARTRVVGPPPAGGGFPVLSRNLLIAGGYGLAIATVPIYGRVPSGQNVTAGNYQSGLGGSAIYWSWSNATYPASCMSGSGGNGNSTFYTSTSATVSNACRITLASDLDFGNVRSVTANSDQTAQITVRCPSGSAWRLGLGNGTYANGTTRRMRSSAGAYITYELYHDAARTQRWGATAGTDTSNGTGAGESAPITRTVHGRVPAQPAVPMGTYSDIVTITLTY